MVASFLTKVPATFKSFEYFGHSIEDPYSMLQLNENTPQEPLEPTQVRVKILSAAVNPVDVRFIQFGDQWCPKKKPATKEEPTRIGNDLAGIVVEIGSKVTDYKVGDAVYGMPDMKPRVFGTFAEYINVDVEYIAPKPENLSFHEAAAVPLAAQTSYQALVTYGKLQAGQRVLILGGSGGTGTFAIQIAKELGAFVITTASPRNLELVSSLGADQVIDYTKDKWHEVLEGGSIDLVYDCGMEPSSWNHEAQKVLKPNTGIFVTISVTQNRIESPIGATHHEFVLTTSKDYLLELNKMIDAGKIKVIIDSVHPFSDTIEVIKTQMVGRARGKLVIEVAKE